MRTLTLTLLLVPIWLALALPTQAVIVSPTATSSSEPVSTQAAATQAGTESSALASPAAVLQQRIQEKQDGDITETGGKQKDKLTAYLEANPLSKLSWNNFLQHAIRRSISKGLPSNIVVLILLFPVIASFIAFSRHMIGLKGFGVYTPAVLSVAFVSTGIFSGILLFAVVLLAALFMKRILKRLNLQYLPRTAMLLWGVSILTLLFFVGLALLPVTIILPFSIFPVLIIMLLTENFMESQLSGNQSEALQLTIETLVTAVFCSFIIGLDVTQRWVILQPELALLLVAILNLAIGRYSGLRLLEWVRFRSIID